MSQEILIALQDRIRSSNVEVVNIEAPGTAPGIRTIIVVVQVILCNLQVRNRGQVDFLISPASSAHSITRPRRRDVVLKVRPVRKAESGSEGTLASGGVVLIPAQLHSALNLEVAPTTTALGVATREIMRPCRERYVSSR